MEGQPDLRMNTNRIMVRHSVSFRQLLREFGAVDDLLGPHPPNEIDFAVLRVEWTQGPSAYQGALVVRFGDVELADLFEIKVGDPARVRRQMLDHYEQRLDWAAQLVNKQGLKLAQDSSVGEFFAWEPPAGED